MVPQEALGSKRFYAACQHPLDGLLSPSGADLLELPRGEESVNDGYDHFSVFPIELLQFAKALEKRKIVDGEVFLAAFGACFACQKEADINSQELCEIEE